MENSSNASEAVKVHYEVFPYPKYPVWMMGRWSDTERVDLRKWGIDGPIRNCWVAGCGTISPLMFGRRNWNVFIDASDLSERSIRILKSRLLIFGIHNVHAVCSDLRTGAPHPIRYDAIDAYGVLHHLEDPNEGLQILSESLRTGGVLRLMVYRTEVRGRIEELRAQILEMDKRPSMKELRDLIRKEGLLDEPEFQTSSGIADALLHPQVETFRLEQLEEMLSRLPRLERIRVSGHSNWVVFLKKIAP